MQFSSKNKSLIDLYKQVVNQDELSAISELKIKLLLSDITGIPATALFLDEKKNLTSKQESLFWQFVQRLKNNEPVQYILGKAPFYGLSLSVNENVLIPRPETEGLVEWLTRQNEGDKTILDIGTGSGAIAIALKYLHPSYKLIATDLSYEAIKTAKSNAKQLGLDITFYQADLFPPVGLLFDIIVSNPPYIAAKEYKTLDCEVQLYEPKLALYAGKDGLSIYRKILKRADKYLHRDGKIYFEIGENQASAIISIAQKFNFNTSILKQDLAGKDRYLCLEK